MEELELSSSESSDAIGSAEKGSEKSEKQRDAYKKAQVQIQKSQKDEQKAQGDNGELFKILERFIQNPYYESLTPMVTELLQRGAPARYIITLIALFYPEATVHLLAAIQRNEDIHLLLSIHKEVEPVKFHEKSLHPTIRTWMSTWVQAGGVYITQKEMSLIQQKKLHDLLKEEPFFTQALTGGLSFFFMSRNVLPEEHIMKQYALHIVGEYTDALAQVLSGGDMDLLREAIIDDRSLFGLEEDGDQE